MQWFTFRKEEQLQNPEAVINSLKTFDKSIKKKPSSQKYIKVANSISEESEDELESERGSGEPKPDYEREDSGKSDDVFPPKPKPLEEKVHIDLLVCYDMILDTTRLKMDPKNVYII